MRATPAPAPLAAPIKASLLVVDEGGISDFTELHRDSDNNKKFLINDYSKIYYKKSKKKYRKKKNFGSWWQKRIKLINIMECNYMYMICKDYVFAGYILLPEV